MNIQIVKCPSGFYAVLADGVLYDGACVSREHAEAVAQRLREGKPSC